MTAHPQLELPARADPPKEEEAYDDSKDHLLCPDCKGSGFYIGLRERSFCRHCDGSGWV